MPAVMSMEEVVEVLGLSATTILRLVRGGHLQAHRPPGRRKWLFRADEVLDSVSSWSSGGEDDGECLPLPPAAAAAEDCVDPTTVWCPTPRAEDDEKPQLEECAEAWLDAARRSGLRAVLVGPTEVDVNGLVYALRSGPRERVRVVDDDGEEAWQLIDAVWAEPTTSIADPPKSGNGRAL